MIIVVDLDGTIFHSDDSVSNYTIEVFRKCKEAGHIIVVNSGRGLMRSLDVAYALGADYINCFYGNLLVDTQGGLLFKRSISPEKTTQVLNDFDGLSPEFFAIETLENFYSTSMQVCERFTGTLLDRENMANNETYHIAIGVPYDAQTIENANKIAQKYGLYIKYSKSGKYCSLLPDGTRKWLGLEQLLKILGKSSDEVISFGDHMTDYETLKNSKVGVAVANSEEELLQKIENHTLSNNDDGVAKFLEEKIL